MPLDPPAKRRRLESAASTLSKPFKSPLRRPDPSSQGTPPSSAPSTTTSTPNPPTNQQPSPSPTSPAVSTPRSLSRTPRQTQTDPILTSLQKTQRTLQSQLAALRTELDTLNQAHRIESSSKDSELETLIAKWRTVSQDAADEVFVGASERVGRMGGMKAWREKARNSAAARWEEEEMEGWFGKAAEGFEEDVKREREEEEEEKMKKEEEEKEGEEDEEFTMEFMLKTLNIDPKVIGFDLTGQRWIR